MALLGVNIDNEKAGRRAHDDADIGIRPALGVEPDLDRIGGHPPFATVAVFGGLVGFLPVVNPRWKYWPTLSGIFQCKVEKRVDVLLFCSLFGTALADI